MPDPLSGLTGQAAKVITALQGGRGIPPWLRQSIGRASITGVGRAVSPWLFNPYTAAIGAGIGIGNIPAVKQATQQMWGISDFDTAYRDYQAGGGALSYNQWVAAGKPKGAQLTPYALGVKEKVEARPPPEDPVARMIQEAQLKATQREEAAWGMPLPGGAQEGTIITQPDGSTGYWTRDENGYPVFSPLTAAKPRGREPYTPYGTNPYDNPETPAEEGQFNPNTGQWEPPVGYVTLQQQWEREESRRQAEETRSWQTQQLAWQQEQAQMQAEAEKQRQLASLRANPASWLEYASLAGQTPAIQPWMLPLMSQQGAGATAGQALPGYQPQQAGQTSMSSLPQLTTPSRQYQARMGPTALAQYGGYERARSGITPEELQWRLWSRAPPSGQFSGLSRR